MIRDGIIIFVRVDMCVGLCLYHYLHLFDEFDYVRFRIWYISSHFALNRDVEKALVTNSSGSRVSERLETVVVLDTTAHICWDSHVDFLWIRKLEIAHNLNKVFHRLVTSKSRIGIFLGTNRRFCSALVIVGGIDDSRIG